MLRLQGFWQQKERVHEFIFNGSPGDTLPLSRACTMMPRYENGRNLWIILEHLKHERIINNNQVFRTHSDPVVLRPCNVSVEPFAPVLLCYPKLLQNDLFTHNTVALSRFSCFPLISVCQTNEYGSSPSFSSVIYFAIQAASFVFLQLPLPFQTTYQDTWIPWMSHRLSPCFRFLADSKNATGFGFRCIFT